MYKRQVEANATYTYFLKYVPTAYVKHFIQDKSATFKAIYSEMSKKPLYLHLATEGYDGPSLKAYDKTFSPWRLFNSIHLGELKTTKLVFLSACYSLQNYNEGNYYDNFGYVLVNIAGAKYVIGSRGRIDTIAAAVFAMEFYDAYFAGDDNVRYDVRIAFGYALAQTKSKLKSMIDLFLEPITDTLLGRLVGILKEKLKTYEFVFEEIVDLAKKIFMDYSSEALTDAVFSLSNLYIYDGSYSTGIGGGGNGGGTHPVII